MPTSPVLILAKINPSAVQSEHLQTKPTIPRLSSTHDVGAKIHAPMVERLEILKSTQEERAILPLENESSSDKELLPAVIRKYEYLRVRKPVSRDPSIHLAIQPSENESSSEKELLPAVVRRLKYKVRMMESRNPSDELTIRRLSSTYDAGAKTHTPMVERLEAFKSAKEFHNQVLKDKGRWSSDWRIALGDLEKHWDPNASNNPTLAMESSAKIHIPRNIRADKIERPIQWTEASFYQYTVQLAYSTVDRLIARQLYQEGEMHIHAVADILERIFASTSTKYVITVGACNVAVKFFFRFGMFARGRNLFERAQELQRNMQPSTYNIMLEAAAAQKDLFHFTGVLKAMISHGVRPNSYSWFLLAQAAPGEEVRMQIFDKLVQERAMQNPATAEKVTSSILSQAATEYLDSRNDPQYLLDFLDSHSRPEWFSGQVCQEIIDQVGVYHSTAQALTILREFCSRGYRPTGVMLLLLLRQCAWSRAHLLAIDILRLFRTEYAIRPRKSQIYDVLWRQAWTDRLYNCCRVIWSHACVAGHTTFRMQNCVKESLFMERSLHYYSQSEKRMWEESAGKAIVGCDPVDCDSKKKRDLMSIWKTAQESRQDRKRFLKKARSMLASDLALSQHYGNERPFDELLSEALAKDLQWVLGHALKEVPPECICSQIIEPALIFQSRSRTASNEESALQPRRDAPPVVFPHRKAVRPDRCWMSPEMRSRPCSCPSYVKD
ncbi:MAG: hypothetical protein Q9207_008130 [Kuettlingeria erythrocarpa]